METSRNNEIKTLPEKIVVVSCFDSRIDVPLHAMYEELKKFGCKTVREEKLAGGGIIYARHLDFANEQIETFSSLGFGGIILVPHTDCLHVRLHEMIPDGWTEDDFMENEMRKGVLNIQRYFPKITSYAYVINTKNSKNGIQSVARCLCSHSDELFA